jgi:hypothetical protein
MTTANTQKLAQTALVHAYRAQAARDYADLLVGRAEDRREVRLQAEAAQRTADIYHAVAIRSTGR